MPQEGIRSLASGYRWFEERSETADLTKAKRPFLRRTGRMEEDCAAEVAHEEAQVYRQETQCCS